MRFFRTVLATIPIIAALAWAAPTYAATLSFDAPQTVSAGDNFTLVVLVDTKDKGFNAAEAAISFPTNVLEVTSIDTAPSATAFNFWITLPTFSNDKGVILFSGGATRGLVGSAVQVLAIHMHAKGVGDATIVASDASVNASDGSGTNILDGIIARRIAVRPAQTTTITPSIVPQSETPTRPDTAASSTPTVMPVTDICDTFFTHCELPSPTIASVSLGPRQQLGTTITVSGTGEPGSQIRLRLNRENVLYKRVYALTGPQGTWEATFDNILAYGSYSIEAATEDSSRRLSQTTLWDNIDIFPPYTLHLFGVPLRWYVVLEDAALALLLLVGGIVLARYPTHKKRWPLQRRALIAAGGIFIVTTIGVYISWQAEFHLERTYWKDTTIACVEPETSFNDEYISVLLSIYVNGSLQTIPANMGITPRCTAAIHTHDNTGSLHIDTDDIVPTLNDFFTITGEPLTRAGYTMSITVNGKDYTSRIGSYILQNNDTVVVRYTSTPSNNH